MAKDINPRNFKPQPKEEEEAQKIGFFRRNWERLANSTFGKYVVRTKDKIINNPLYKIVTSLAVSRAFSVAYSIANITLAALAITGVSIGIGASFILAPYVAIPLAVASIAAVGIGAAVDTYLVRRTRKLYEENKYLSRHCLAKNVQDRTLEQHPKLAHILDDQLYKPVREGKKSVTERYAPSGASKTRLKVGSAAIGAVTKFFAGIVSIASAVVSKNPLTIARTAGSSTVAMGSGAYSNVSMSVKRDEFRECIDKLRADSSAPGYNSLRELKEIARKQKIQSMALQQVVADNAYKAWIEEEMRQKFLEKVVAIERREKAVHTSSTAVSLGKDFLRAHNPWSKYVDPTKLTTELRSQELAINPETKTRILPKEVKSELRDIRAQVDDRVHNQQQPYLLLRKIRKQKEL